MVYFNFSLFSLVNVIAVSSAYTISFTFWLLLNNNDRSFVYIILYIGEDQVLILVVPQYYYIIFVIFYHLSKQLVFDYLGSF